MDFAQLATTKVGDIGETLVFNLLMNKIPNITIESPYCTKEHGGHMIDACISNSKSSALVEVKTKPVMSVMEKDGIPLTGMDANDWVSYKKLMGKWGDRILITFVDPALGCVYGGSIAQFVDPDIMDHPTSNSKKHGLALWKLTRMKLLHTMLPDEHIMFAKRYLEERSSRYWPSLEHREKCRAILGIKNCGL